MTTKQSKRYDAVCHYFQYQLPLAPHARALPYPPTPTQVHEKLKLGSKEVLNCYYAHAEDGMQRRCYWLLEEGYDAIVLVHYLNISHTKAARKQGWIQPRPIDPVTGLLPTAPPPPPPSTATSLGRRVSLSFSAEPMVSSHSMTTMTASGSFTITTGHSMVPVAEFRLNSKESLLGKVEGQEESAAEVLHGGDQGRVRHQQPLQSYGVTAAAHGVLPASPFSAQRQDAPGAAPDSPTRVVHGFDPEVLNLNRGGALPSGHGTTPAQLECSQNDAAAGEAQASNLAAAFVARSVRQGSTGLRPSAAFVPYHPGQGGDGSDGSNVGVRRGSQAAVSAFE